MVPAEVRPHGPRDRHLSVTERRDLGRCAHAVAGHGERMADESELRATSDSMLSMLDEVRGLESRKREHVVGTEEFAHLAWEVAELARVIVRWSELQLRQANEALTHDGTEGVPLVDVPARRLDHVLADWRQAEMRLSQALPGSADAESAAAEVARLREEYSVLQDRKIVEQRRR